MSNLIFVSLFVLFIILRVIMAKKAQSTGQMRTSKAVEELSSPDPQQRTPFPADDDDAGFSPPRIPPRESPRPVSAFLVERSAQDAGTPKPPAGIAFPQKLDYLPPLKRAVVLAEILGPPKGF
jgi:hypothetical protein